MRFSWMKLDLQFLADRPLREAYSFSYSCSAKWQRRIRLASQRPPEAFEDEPHNLSSSASTAGFRRLRQHRVQRAREMTADRLGSFIQEVNGTHVLGFAQGSYLRWHLTPVSGQGWQESLAFAEDPQNHLPRILMLNDESGTTAQGEVMTLPTSKLKRKRTAPVQHSSRGESDS
jgi:hypothetical protein